uniref:DOP1 leucine zipper like protein A n=1 Tax=Maylandia zebra TaxID=106582 RepID=A0A3P9DUG5_9CICH
MVGILQGKARGGEEESILMHDLKPFRILISLLDKPELGPAILEDVLIEVFRTLHTQCRTELDLQNQSPFSKDHTHLSSKLRENKKTAELIKTANLLFNSFEPYYMWDYIAHWFEECCSSATATRHVASADPPELLLVEFCQLVDFLLDIVSLETYIEIQTEHLPQLLLRMVAALTCHLQALGLGELTHCLRLCSKILSKVQPPLGLSSSIGKPSNSTLPSTLEGPGTEDVFEDVENTPSCRSESGFTEFVQYQGDVPEEAEHTPHPHSTVRTGRRSSGPCHSKPLDKPVMQCCLEHFQQFLSVNKVEGHRGEVTQSGLLVSESSQNGDHAEVCSGSGRVQKECIAAFTAACQLFLECSSFPVYIAEGNLKSSPRQEELEQVRLPLWLQTLMDACCLASDFSLQCVAISLLMDLVGLTQSVAMVTAESVASGASSESTQPMSPSQGRVAVVIRPPLTQGILKHIADKTDFFKSVALICGTTQCGIFYQLHNLVPSSSICEDVISHHAQDKVSISAHITSKNQIKEIHAEACSVSISLHNAGLPELLGSICTSAVGRAWLNQTHRVSIQRVQAQRHLAQVFPEPPERSHQNPFTTETLASQTVKGWTRGSPSDSLSIMSLSSENLHLAGEYQPAHQQGEPQSSGLHWFSFFLQWKMQLEEPEGVKCMINGRKRSHSSIQLSLKGKIMEKLADKSPGAKPKIKKIKRKEEERQRKANQADKLRPPSIFFGDSLDLENWYSCGEGEVSEIESDTGSPRRRSSSHVLLYLQLYDSSRALHALSAIAAMLRAAPSGFVSAISTTSINNTYTPQLSLLQNLLARHRLPLHSFRSAMYLEIIISLCLYFLRSYYSAHVPAGPQDLVLTLLFSELAKVTGGSAKGFASFISDVLSKCKVQKVVLHCLLSSIFSAQKWHEQRVAGVNMATVEEGLSEDIQAQLLRLLQSLVVLEHRVLLDWSSVGAGFEILGGEVEHVNPQQPMTSLQYLHGQPITAQGMFLCSVIRALHQHHACKMHPQWIGLITATLPYMGRVLRRVVASVTLQLCRNLDNLLQQYRYETGITDTRY